ncbi:MAG: hypothetical protein APF84_12220 [Gracilibacter sp. BRH_c7a]|nr:MAG: hypothetical protein APF84_12220 [Gracilibacter sp. BRH_c7a]
MSNFDYLLLAHLLGDFLFQTKWMADNKANNWFPLLIHSFIYTLIIWITSYFAFGGLSLEGCSLLFAAHLILDRRTFINLWTSKIMRLDNNAPVWIRVVIDQTFHLIILAIALHV